MIYFDLYTHSIIFKRLSYTFYDIVKQDGRVLCSSSPIYGEGDEIGNEEGYIVGMSTCYPKLGDVKINKGEIGSFVSKYDPTQNHTGVMGIFSIVVATKLPNSLSHMEV